MGLFYEVFIFGRNCKRVGYIRANSEKLLCRRTHSWCALDGKKRGIFRQMQSAPKRINKKHEAPKTLLDFLRAEKAGAIKDGIYHKVQMELTYNSNHIEGNRLTHDQTRYIFETNTIGMDTTAPERVSGEMRELIQMYNKNPEKTLTELIDFHVRFERIHPFRDGNGRVGRLILFKECLRCNIVPFIIDEELKMYYYRGLKEWYNERGFLTDTCLAAQDKFKKYLDYFRIPYAKRY